MGDVLSQSEVESLLAALDPGMQPTHQASATRRNDFNSQISVYDFKRPERVSKDQMRALQALHEGFSREYGAALSGMLRAIIEVKLISVDQLTYSEFVFSLENPTCFTLLHSRGLEGHLILDLNPSIVFPIIDRLLGGGKDSANFGYPNRPLSEIEQQLVGRLNKEAIRALENAWANIRPLDLKVDQIESNPQLVQIVPPNEVIVLISFEVTMGELRGIMNLCIPFNTIEPLASKLSSDSWSTYTKKANDPRQQVVLEAGVSKAAVPISVQLAHTTLTATELANLSVGDIILTEKDQSSGLEVSIAGAPLFTAFPGVVKGHKAIRIGAEIVQARNAIAQKLASLGISIETPVEKSPAA